MNTFLKNRLPALLLCLCTLISCVPAAAQEAQTPYISEVMAQNGTYRRLYESQFDSVT